ncbi:methyltransferase domain-containing protein [Mucilaginibacter sabulilitoris]|uniref:Methyltransferase domain-containing protein n=1 Tax=Mucilaginibacter sabulilitoris TaxID=1173583 RepID=A0ABZ0TPS4_9SPHI|nr:methyltransferase domain-containing protein [Mucilaginibacter sabulilitoris]WPU95132.1 methyltransferase domain-containing protein [Mucilaginibacter sabulilitoris]
MAANYNNSAWFYDRLSRLVYSKALVNAQLYLLDFIEPGSNVLIAGGGTGWILDEITKLHPTGLHITYVEIAAGMMALSQKRNTGQNEVVYINDAIENVSLTPNFDVVITPFLFDNFTEQTLTTVFNHIHSLLIPGGLWLNADFQLTGKWWQGFLLKSMFLFFKVICDIEASKLPAIETHFTQNGYNAIAEKTFFNEFIMAKVYRGK